MCCIRKLLSVACQSDRRKLVELNCDRVDSLLGYVKSDDLVYRCESSHEVESNISNPNDSHQWFFGCGDGFERLIFGLIKDTLFEKFRRRSGREVVPH